MQMRAQSFLGALLTTALVLCGCGASPAVIADKSKGSSSRQGSSSTTDTVRSVIASFVRADTDTQYSMMSDHYRTVFKNTDYLRAAFSKESYRVLRFEDTEAFTEKGGRQLVYVRVVLEWRFESYEGIQTCHFNLLREANGWRVDWFLC